MEHRFYRPICPQGHDKRVTGVYSNNACKVCVGMNQYKPSYKAQRKKYNSSARGKTIRSKWLKSFMSDPDNALRYKEYKWKAYGIKMENGQKFSRSDYKRIYIEQKGRCANLACNKRAGFLKLVPDHDHATGFFRGLLCVACNLALGQAKDSKDILFGLADYISRKVLHGIQ